MKVELYCLSWNDSRMLPFFFRHYDPWVDRYFIYDNGSTDNSLSLFKKHARITLAHFDVKGDSFVDEERRMGDSIWKNSDADWVIVTDIDEHIYHPDLLAYLQRAKQQGITAIQSIGYEMIADDFPAGTGALVDQVTLGARSTGHDRLCIFNPRAITQTNFTPGRHQAAPEGRVVWPEEREVLLLHFKQLGVDYPIARSAELLQGMRPRDVEQGWGMHYSWSANQIRANWQRMRALSGPVPGLGSLKHIAPVNYAEEERVVRVSGLIEDRWYLDTYPDVGWADADPLLHFCIHGWREGRKPNFYFDPEWYCLNYPELSVEGRNPLFDYLIRGERADAWPSPHFNTPWYREVHGLGSSESPLRHYMHHRKNGRVSPLPEFNVVQYRERYPGTISEDPYETFCSRQT